MGAELTLWVLILILSVLIVYDVVIMVTSGVKATISQVLFNLSWRHPIIPFGLGVVTGHILWPNCGDQKILAAACLVGLIFNVEQPESKQ